MTRPITVALPALAVLAFSLGCSMDQLTGGAGTGTATSSENPSETCCCEYKEEGAKAPSYSEMAKSNCESWGYACVADDRCAAAADVEEAEEAEPASGGTRDEAGEAAEVKSEEPTPAPAPVSTTSPKATTGGGATRTGGGASRTGGTSTRTGGTTTRPSTSSGSSKTSGGAVRR